MPPKIQLSYTSKDWNSLRTATIARIPSETNGRWTDLNTSDLGITIVETLVGMFDQLHYYLDKQVNELTLPNAIQRANVINLLKLIGYDIRGYEASVGIVKFQIAPSPVVVNYPVTIPKGTEVAGNSIAGDRVSFFTTNDVVIASPSVGSPAATKVAVIQGIKLSSPEIFISDGTASQSFVLRTEKVSRPLLIVRIGSSEATSEEWTQVNTFLTSVSNDKVFRSFEDADGRIYIQLGDGRFGAIPTLGNNVYIYPIITEGSIGNLAANTITQVLSEVVDAVGNKVTLQVNNDLAVSGGSDPESIETAKRNGPALFSALYRAMSKADYTALIQSIPRVDKANTWGEQEEIHPNLKLMNRVTITFLALDAYNKIIDPESTTYTLSMTPIKNAVFELLEERKPITTRIVFKKPEWVDILVNVQVAVDRTRFDPIFVEADVKLAIQEFYSYTNVLFGQDARLSALNQLIMSVPGVSWAIVKLGKYNRSLPNHVQVTDFTDIPVSRWELIRINDYDSGNNPILLNAYPHVTVTSTTAIDAPVPNPLPNPCAP